MKLLIDAGHGLGNRHPGVMDSGAEGNGTTEHAEVEKLRSDVIANLAGRITVVPVPNVNKTLRDKGEFIVANFAPDDVFLSLHLNAADAASATGAEILFDDQKPQNEPEARRLIDDYAAATSLRNRGAKPDTVSHEGNVFVLGKCPGRGYLLECGFITNANDLAVVRAKAADAITAMLLKLFKVALPAQTTSPVPPER